MPAVQPLIREIGHLTPVDAQGRIVNPCAAHLVADPWREPLDALIAICSRSLGPALQSLHLRGSVPRGLAIEGVSDIDLVCVLAGPIPRLPPRWHTTVERAVCRRHPCCARVELSPIALQRLLHAPDAHAMRFFLKTQALCVHGIDPTTDWPAFHLADAHITLTRLSATIGKVRDFLRDTPQIGPLGVSRRCRWVMKKIVRAGFELVAEREHAYTRDLYPCWQAFSRHYPEQAEPMRQALVLAIAPTSDRARIDDVLRIGDWVAAHHFGA